MKTPDAFATFERAGNLAGDCGRLIRDIKGMQQYIRLTIVAAKCLVAYREVKRGK